MAGEVLTQIVFGIIGTIVGSVTLYVTYIYGKGLYLSGLMY